VKINTLFDGLGGPCQDTNHGDPNVLYDTLADRWLISQFALPNIAMGSGPFYQCVAVSQSGDPLGGWHRYEFLFDASLLNDYPRFAIWPDGYYATFNLYDLPTSAFRGMAVAAYERDAMLTGAPARQALVKLDAAPFPINTIGGGLPADLDGRTLPPTGEPELIVAPEAAEWTHFDSDRLHLFRFHVDWLNPANSTLSGPVALTTTAWSDLCPTTRACVPQPVTSARLDALADRLMWRLSYRNFGDHTAIVGNHTVDDGNGRAGLRWFELRNVHALTPTLVQQAVFAPTDGVWRWMGSAAMDNAGNLALAYSAAGADTFPSLRISGRLADDPPNSLTLGERVLDEGGGSQTSVLSRWGDYSQLTLDPLDDCTFWFTGERLSTTSPVLWATTIAAFRFPGCTTGLPNVLMAHVTDVTSGLPISGAHATATNGLTFTLEALSESSGSVTFPLPAHGTVTLTVQAYGYLERVIILDQNATPMTHTLAVTMAMGGHYTVSGQTLDLDTAQPIAAVVTARSPFPAVITTTSNAGDGAFTLAVAGGSAPWVLSAVAPHYALASAALGPVYSDATVTLRLQALKTAPCPGTFDDSGPTYQRTLIGNPPTGLAANAPAVQYRAMPFSVSTSGLYSIVMQTAEDGFYTLYLGAFDPVHPLSNALEANDDAVGLAPAIRRTLIADAPYVLVASTYQSGVHGPFTDTVTGFGHTANVCPTAGPPPVTPTPSPTPNATPTPTPTPEPCGRVMRDARVEIPSAMPAGICVPIAVQSAGTVATVSVQLALTHTWLGDLTVWLVDPGGLSLTLINRPGLATWLYGSSADLTSAWPVTVSDTALLSTSAMGDLLGDSDMVCQDTGICVFRPPGSALASFVGRPVGGQWQVCASDALPGDDGTLARVALDLTCESTARAWLPILHR